MLLPFGNSKDFNDIIQLMVEDYLSLVSNSQPQNFPNINSSTNNIQGYNALDILKSGNYVFNGVTIFLKFIAFDHRIFPAVGETDTDSGRDGTYFNELLKLYLNHLNDSRIDRINNSNGLDISFDDIRDEYDNPNSISLREHYNVGVNSPAVGGSNPVPTSGAISLNNFYGTRKYRSAQKDIPAFNPDSPRYGFSATGQRRLWTHYPEDISLSGSGLTAVPTLYGNHPVITSVTDRIWLAKEVPIDFFYMNPDHYNKTPARMTISAGNDIKFVVSPDSDGGSYVQIRNIGFLIREYSTKLAVNQFRMDEVLVQLNGPSHTRYLIGGNAAHTIPAGSANVLTDTFTPEAEDGLYTISIAFDYYQSNVYSDADLFISTGGFNIAWGNA
tara:strand:- start:1600 stop:2757 length:1158 start_codon:yes stop_codon:yes gene_type:complete